MSGVEGNPELAFLALARVGVEEELQGLNDGRVGPLAGMGMILAWGP